MKYFWMHNQEIVIMLFVVFFLLVILAVLGYNNTHGNYANFVTECVQSGHIIKE